MQVDKNDPIFMKEYLRYVTKFEEYVYVWQNSVRIAEQKCASLVQERNALLQKRNMATNNLAAIDSTIQKEANAIQRKINKIQSDIKRTKKFKIFGACSFVIGIVMLIFGGVSFVTSKGENSSLTMLLVAAGFGLTALGVMLVFSAFAYFDGLLYSKLFNKPTKKQLLDIYTEELRQFVATGQSTVRKNQINGEISRISSDIEKINYSIQLAEKNKSQFVSVLVKAKNTLNDMYAMNVLPEKYRTLTAVATLYEYLENGVCIIVMGHGGIYDAYENHFRMGLIISKLDEISRKLDVVIANQKFLYDELRKCNDTLGKISSEVSQFKQAFGEFSVASLTAQNQLLEEVKYQNWKNS